MRAVQGRSTLHITSTSLIHCYSTHTPCLQEKMKLNEPGRQKTGTFLAVGEACRAMFSLTPSFKDTTSIAADSLQRGPFCLHPQYPIMGQCGKMSWGINWYTDIICVQHRPEGLQCMYFVFRAVSSLKKDKRF